MVLEVVPVVVDVSDDVAELVEEVDVPVIVEVTLLVVVVEVTIEDVEVEDTVAVKDDVDDVLERVLVTVDVSV